LPGHPCASWDVERLIVKKDSSEIYDFQTITRRPEMLFIALHGMPARTSYEKAVRPSVCLSVKRVDCGKTEESSVQIFKLYERSFSLV